MEGYRSVPYAEWLELVDHAKTKGARCKEFQQLQKCYPDSAGFAYERMIQNELAKLETLLLRSAVKKFQRAINLCLEENDLETLECAMWDFRKSIRGCFFFVGIPGYPESVRKDLAMQMEENLLMFQREFEKFIKRLSQNDNSLFTQDLIYRYRKWNLSKIIREYRSYV